MDIRSFKSNFSFFGFSFFFGFGFFCFGKNEVFMRPRLLPA